MSPEFLAKHPYECDLIRLYDDGALGHVNSLYRDYNCEITDLLPSESRLMKRIVCHTVEQVDAAVISHDPKSQQRLMILAHCDWRQSRFATKTDSPKPNNTMDFFKQLTEASPNLDLTLRLMRGSKDGKITIHLIPGNYEVKHLELTGTAEELDAEFFNIVSRPLTLVNGIQTNAGEFEAAVAKGLDASEKKQEAKKPVEKAKAEKPAAAKTEEVKAPVAFPYPAGSKMVVTAPGRLRAKEGIVNDTSVNEKGEVAVDFADGKDWVAVKDLALVKKPVDAKPIPSLDEMKKKIEAAGTLAELNQFVAEHPDLKSDMLQRIIDVRRLELDKPAGVKQAAPATPAPAASVPMP